MTASAADFIELQQENAIKKALPLQQCPSGTPWMRS